MLNVVRWHEVVYVRHRSLKAASEGLKVVTSGEGVEPDEASDPQPHSGQLVG